MKLTSTILALLLATTLATGCARPLYVAKSDTQATYIYGEVAKIRETLHNNISDASALPRVLGNFDIYTEITYNCAGNIILIKAFRGPDSMQIINESYFYDPSGERMMRSESRNPAKRTVRIFEYVYDEQGSLVSERETTGLRRVEFINNRRGYLKKETNIVNKDSVSSVTRYRYDLRGLLRTARDEGYAIGNSVTRYKYHSDGTVAEISHGKWDTEKYDTRGNLVSITSVVRQRNENGRVARRFPVTINATYEYDSLGNWVRRMQLYDGKVQNVRVREIDYFKELVQ